LGGGSDLNQYVMNLSLMNTPSKNWYIVPAVRVEKQDTGGIATDNAVTGAPAQVVSPATTFARSAKDALYVTESLDIRYTGITNWAFYARMEFSEDQADLSERFGANITLAPTLFRDTEWTRLQQKYTIGANWYPARKVNFAAQYYRKMSDNDYTHTLDSSVNTGGGDRYPGYFGSQKFDVDDVNFRVTWRPMPLLTLVSRYDYQLSRVNTRPEGLPEIESGVSQRHMFGQSISWTPINRLYVQGSGNYVLDTTHSPVEDLTGAASGIVLSAPNKYWMASCIVGFALDNKTDLQTTYSYYRADNYVDNSAIGLPYGSGARQHEVGATLGRQITRNLRWTLRYAYSKYQDQTSGGALNYEAHGILSSMQYRF
jgi:predicted porin